MASIDSYKSIYISFMKQNQKRFSNYVSKIRDANIPYRRKKYLINNAYKRYLQYKRFIKRWYKSKIKSSQRNTISNLNTTFTNKKALVIGCNYTNTQYSLRGCINDANDIYDHLRSKGFSTINKITDFTPITPTLQNIINQLVVFIKDLKENDLGLFYFSGHGYYVRDKSGDELDGKDEVIVSHDLKFIKDDTLRKVIDKYMNPKATLVTLFDACHSGTMMDLPHKYLSSSSYERKTDNARVDDTKANVICLSGCLDNQVSIDAQISNKNTGAFTWALLETLKENSSVSWINLVKQMREKLRSNNFTQIPEITTGRYNSLDSSVFI